jgi:lipid-binding SYLF domain-containing protein
MNRARALPLVAAIAALALLAAPATAGERQRQKLRAAAEVYRELLDTPDRKVPSKLIEEARCLAVIPGVIKGAFVWGGRHGRGVLTCRDEGVWSPPIFVTMSGGSFGFQIGGQASDFVLFFITDRSVRSLLRSEFTFGGDASISAGPLGRTAEASTDLRLTAEIYSYAKSRGLYAGLSLEGARLAANRKWIQAYYGERLWPEQVLYEGAISDPGPAARQFLDVLP